MAAQLAIVRFAEGASQPSHLYALAFRSLQPIRCDCQIGWCNYRVRIIAYLIVAVADHLIIEVAGS